MAKRRARGEGGIYQRHDHPSCPPPDTDGQRPDHRCRGTWIAVHDLGWIAGKRVRKVRKARTRGEARDKLNALRQRYPTGSAVNQGKRTVEQWMEEYLNILVEEERIRPQTLRGYQSKNRTYIVPLLGQLRIDQIDAAHLDAMFANMKKRGLSESTRRQVFMILRRAFKVAMRRRLIERNPCDMIDPPGTHKNDVGRLTVEQAWSVLELADREDNGFNAARWWAALFLGVRQGEALGIRLGDVDLADDLLYVRTTLQQDIDGAWVLDRPKSARSVRAIPMPSMARARLAVQVAKRRAEGAGDEDVLFGGRLHWYTPPWDDSDDWHALLEAAGVPQVQLRAARSTTASLLDEAKVPPRLQSEILGHTQVQFTQDTYVKGDLEGRRAAMAALESYYATGRKREA